MDHDIDWVALAGSWILSYGLLQVMHFAVAIPLMLIIVFAWHSRWKRRHAISD